MNNKIKNILIIIVLLLTVAGSFYWFELRPANIRQDCFESFIKIEEGTLEDREWIYNYCIKVGGPKNLEQIVNRIEENLNSQKLSKPQKEDKDDLMKKIKIESINTKEEGNEYCKGGYFNNECVNKISTKGKIFIIEVSLKNISKKPVSVSWGLSTLIDDQNREFEEWDYEGYDLWSKQKISPGFSETKQGIYEVPKNSNPEKISISFPSFEDKTIELNKK